MMSKINFTARTMLKPEGMSLKAELEWARLAFNDGGWVAAMLGDGAVIVTDESADFSTGFACSCEDAFVEWLEQSSDDCIKFSPRDFLADSGAVNPALLSDDVVEAAVAALKGVDEKRKEAAEHGASISDV